MSWENLHIEDWITVTAAVRFRRGGFMGMFGSDEGPGEEWTREPADGVPLRVVSLDFPWILVYNPVVNDVVPIDSRNVKWTKMSEHYVSSALPSIERARESEAAREEERKNRLDQFGRRCPECGNPRPRVMRNMFGDWELRCQECGFRTREQH